MTIKTGVRILGIKPETLLALMIAESVYRDHQQECVITSVVEGEHSRGSIHYQGFAFDLRTSNLGQDLTKIFSDLKERLGADFDVVLEKDHIHTEFQPKSAL